MFIKPNNVLGVGINYRSEVAADIVANLAKLDFIEVFTEKFFMDTVNPHLQAMLNAMPIVLHGLDLSVGSQANVNKDYLSNLRRVLSDIKCEWFGDHISLTQEEGIEVGHLMPICFTEENVDLIAKKVHKIKQLTEKPFILENITYYYPIPGGTLSELQFIKQILTQADCGMLLDINNLYINSVNHEYDPIIFLEHLPIERVVEIHIAGGSYKHNMLVDTHANPISGEVWKLFEYVCQKVPFNGVIIERDTNLPRFEDLLEEVEIARSIMRKYGVKIGVAK